MLAQLEREGLRMEMRHVRSHEERAVPDLNPAQVGNDEADWLCKHINKEEKAGGFGVVTAREAFRQREKEASKKRLHVLSERIAEWKGEASHKTECFLFDLAGGAPNPLSPWPLQPRARRPALV